MKQAYTPKCLGCEANLEYDIEAKAWKCKYCGIQYNSEDFFERNHGDGTKTLHRHRWYKCKNCNASILVERKSVSDACPYCGSSAIFADKLAGNYKIDKIIPFKLQESDILLLIKSHFGSKLELNEFKKNAEDMKIKGMYIPYWLYTGNISGTKKTLGNKISVLSEYSMEFENCPVDALKDIDDLHIQQVEPFEYEELKDFVPEYLAGFHAFNYEINKSEGYKLLKTRMEKEIDNTIASEQIKFTMYDETYPSISYSIYVDMKTEINDINLALFPVYIVSFKLYNKEYECFINGQTGKAYFNFKMHPNFKVYPSYQSKFEKLIEPSIFCLIFCLIIGPVAVILGFNIIAIVAMVAGIMIFFTLFVASLIHDSFVKTSMQDTKVDTKKLHNHKSFVKRFNVKHRVNRY